MFDSKALREWPPGKERSKLYLWWIESPIVDFYYDITHKFIKDPIFQVKRLLQWYWNVFRFDYDFDAHCVFAILEYKLKRVQKALDAGYSVQDPKEVKALKLAIKLADRLKEDKYNEAGYDRIEKKWGKLNSWFTDCEDKKGYSQWHSKYENVKNEEDEAECRKDIKAMYIATDNQMKRDSRNFYAILHKYLRSWWD